MKRYGHLWDQCFTLDALHAAFVRARKGKANTRACFAFQRRLGANLYALHDELHLGIYRPRPHRAFAVHEPKYRIIYAPAFRDHVVQHAIYPVVYPLFDRGFIDQSFACRISYGTHAAADYVQRALRRSARDSYVLKTDIKKFFYRVSRPVLRALIERRIKDRALVELMMRFADHGQPLGMPIGNLLCQLYASILLNPLDHFVKRQLGVRLYARYMDDCVLMGLTRAQAEDCLERLGAFLHDRLALEFSRTSITPISRGVNFVGYRTWASRRFVRKHSLFAYRRAIKHNHLQGVVSQLAHARHTASFRHMMHTLMEMNYDLYTQLPENYLRWAQWHHGVAAPAAG